MSNLNPETTLGAKLAQLSNQTKTALLDTCTIENISDAGLTIAVVGLEPVTVDLPTQQASFVEYIEVTLKKMATDTSKQAFLTALQEGWTATSRKLYYTSRLDKASPMKNPLASVQKVQTASNFLLSSVLEAVPELDSKVLLKIAKIVLSAEKMTAYDSIALNEKQAAIALKSLEKAGFTDLYQTKSGFIASIAFSNVAAAMPELSALGYELETTPAPNADMTGLSVRFKVKASDSEELL